MNRTALTLVLGIVMIAVAFIIFPIVLEGAEEIRTHASIDSYTGLSSLVTVGPTVIFVAMLFGGTLLTWVGLRGYSASRKSKSKSKT